MAVILGIQTGGFARWDLWRQFRDMRAEGFGVGEFYRHSSIGGLLHHGAAIFAPKLGLDAGAATAVADGMYLVAVVRSRWGRCSSLPCRSSTSGRRGSFGWWAC